MYKEEEEKTFEFCPGTEEFLHNQDEDEITQEIPIIVEGLEVSLFGKLARVARKIAIKEQKEIAEVVEGLLQTALCMLGDSLKEDEY